MRKNDGTLLSSNEHVPNELNSRGAGAMSCSGLGVVGGKGTPRSNQDSTRAHRNHSGVGD